MTPTLSPIGLLLTAAALAPAGEPGRPATIRVLAPDGKPVAGARVVVVPYEQVRDRHKPDPPARVTDAAGQVAATAAAAGRPSPYVFVRDAAGRIGGGLLHQWWEVGELSGPAEFVLLDPVERSGRVTDPSGKPRAGAEVTPVTIYLPHNAPWGDRRPNSVYFPNGEQARLAVRADADGRFTLKGLAAGYHVRLRVSAPGAGETTYTALAGAAMDVKHAAAGSVRVTVTGVDPSKLLGQSCQLTDAETAARPAGDAAIPERYAGPAFTVRSPFVIPNVPPGWYWLTVQPSASCPATPGPVESLEVKPGAEAAATLPFRPAARVTGRVVSREGGKGVAGVRVAVNYRPGDPAKFRGPGDGQTRYLGSVVTGPDGTYTAYGPPGWLRVSVEAAPDGYVVPPEGTGPTPPEPAAVAADKPHAFGDLALLGAVTLKGKVVLPGGRPAAGATLLSPGVNVLAPPVFADGSGAFVFKNLVPGDVIAVRARLGKAANVPFIVELGRNPGPVTVEVSEANAARFRGRVEGPTGAVAGATVRLIHHVPGLGRFSSFGYTIDRAVARTDADGRFAFEGFWPRDTYHLHIAAPGYADQEVNDLRGEAGVTRDVPAVKLRRVGLSVSGTVTEDGGRPVAGAEVFTTDGPAAVSATTAADGRFSLAGFYDAPGFVFARKAGYRLSAVPVVPGDGRAVAVVLRKADVPPDPAPVVSAAGAAAQEKFLRHLLRKMWETRTETGYGGSAVQCMARIDPPLARSWVDAERARPGGKTNWGRLVDEAEREKNLFAIAREDPDEAVALLRDVKGDGGFLEVLRLGRRLLEVDRAKAARLAEEAVVRARQMKASEKVWSLAEAGELAARAGNRAGGERVVREAAELSEKLSAGGRDRDSMARGMAAARLAPFDGPRANALLAALKDPTEYNRFLASAAAQVAAVDPARAKEMLGHFRPDNTYYRQEARLLVAYEIVGERPDEAAELVAGVDFAPYRVLGLVRLAVLTAPRDRARAARLIDRAVGLLDSDPDGFRSWSNFGGRAGLAVVAAVRGNQIGHPDAAGLVAHVLALRPTGQEAIGTNDREDRLVNVAAALALVDPTTARRVLAGVAPPDRIVDKALSRKRDWVFAMALADPERACELVDRLFERAAADRGPGPALQSSGVLELARILTAADRYEELSTFGSLSREIRVQD